MTTETAPQFKADAIGTTGDPVTFEVTKERIAAYSAATNDSTPAHAEGEIAPPVFAIVPAFQAAGMASMQVIPASCSARSCTASRTFTTTARSRPGWS